MSSPEFSFQQPQLPISEAEIAVFKGDMESVVALTPDLDGSFGIDAAAARAATVAEFRAWLSTHPGLIGIHEFPELREND